MAVMEREAWTDKRLDDLNRKVDEGFKDMREEFRATRAEGAAFRSETSKQFAAQNRMMIQLLATMMVGFLGVIAAIVTQA
jgi:F0F1-type ATP synthase assembly protein I